MKTAKEMFEELGYKMRTSYALIKYEKDNGECIGFDLYDRVFYKDGGNDRRTKAYNERINMDEFKAIHQQMKELHWIEE